jgi:hypothetical protein
MPSTQRSQLLASLFDAIDEDQRLTVLHIGAALPETVDFFSRFRCKLHFIDLFSELPIVEDLDSDLTVQQQFSSLLQFPEGTVFDICLFWDLFNYLDSVSIAALCNTLRPHLHPGSRAHGFGVHNRRTPQGDQLYGICTIDQLKVRQRNARLPGYAPHNQQQLQQQLDCFSFVRSVLLSDSRMELLLRARS